MQFYDTIKQRIILEQKIVLDGNITLDECISVISSHSVATVDKNALAALIKVTGIKFTESEKTLLINKGIESKLLNTTFCFRNQIVRHKKNVDGDSIIKFVPLIKISVFQTLNICDIKIDSLRKSSMFCPTNPPIKIVCVYMQNGLSYEEIKLAYDISDQLVMEFYFGCDKLLTRKDFVSEYMENEHLKEKK